MSIFLAALGSLLHCALSTAGKHSQLFCACSHRVCMCKCSWLLQVGLFSATPEQKIYPNPAAAAAVPDAYALFEFLGKMLGKAMYEVGLLACAL